MSATAPAEVLSVTSAQDRVGDGEANAISVAYSTHLQDTQVTATLVLNRRWYDDSGAIDREETLLTDDVSMNTTETYSTTYPVVVDNETGESGETVTVCGFLTEFSTTPIGGF